MHADASTDVSRSKPGHNRVNETFTRQMALCEGMSVCVLLCNCYFSLILLCYSRCVPAACQGRGVSALAMPPRARGDKLSLVSVCVSWLFE